MKEIEQITINYVDALSNFPELGGYNISLTIEPKKIIKSEHTGTVDIQTIRSWKTTGKYDEGFLICRTANGNAYYYQGKLTTTVK